MAQVTEIRKQRGTAQSSGARLDEMRARLGMELQQLTDEHTFHRAAPAARERLDVAGRAEREITTATEIRIRLLGQLIAGLAMAEPGTLWADRAGYGSTVFLRNLDSGAEVVYTLMAGQIIDLDSNQVSLASPVGRALLGCRVGDEAVVQAPQGRKRYRVFALETLPEALGMADPVGPDAA